jgi:ADP-ribosyl-[dinitrogen reductase] hydrolase
MKNHMETLHTGKHLHLVRSGRWEFAHRPNASAVVGIVAVTPDDRLLLVEQFRIPVDARVIELPAGLVGDEQADEDIAAAAGRELEEETGWRAAACEVLARGPSSAGLTDEIITLVRATGLIRMSEGGGVAGEDITVHAIPLAEVTSWLARQAAGGRLIDHKIQAGLWWLAQPAAAPRSTNFDRIRAGLWGVIIGDSLGVPVEFTDRADRDADPVIGMRAFGSHNQPAGTWSDDSSLTLATADGLAAGDDDRGIMGRFVRWLDTGAYTAHGNVFDIGNTTRRAIQNFSVMRVQPERCGGVHERDNGNGSLMRILPIALFAHGQSDANIAARAAQASCWTHAHPISQACCAWYAIAAAHLVRGEDWTAACAAATTVVRSMTSGATATAMARILEGRLGEAPRSAIASSGYVVHSLEAAIWCLSRHVDYAGAVLAAVNLGHDTDTTAAITGGLAGVRVGMSGIPAEWLSAIQARDRVAGIIERFTAQAG